METKSSVKNKYDENLVYEINRPDTPTNKPLVLILHALTGKKENSTINFLAKNLPQHGYTTVQFDFSGHGESGGKLEDSTVTKQLEDIEAVADEIRKKVDVGRMIVVGNSFSVITALAYSKDNRSVAGLILISGRANYMKYVENLERVGERYRLIGDTFVGESFVKDYEKYDPLKNMKAFQGPVMIVHGENDETIPKEDAQIFYSSAVSAKKKLFIVPKGGHRFTEPGQKESVLKEIVQFLDENSKPSKN